LWVVDILKGEMKIKARKKMGELDLKDKAGWYRITMNTMK
jgi:hypothetical protein